MEGGRSSAETPDRSRANRRSRCRSVANPHEDAFLWMKLPLREAGTPRNGDPSIPGDTFFKRVVAGEEVAVHAHGQDNEDAWKRFVEKLVKPAKPARTGPIRLVCFDLDGVLIEAKSSWVAVHEAFGVRNDESLRLFLHGEISEEEFIRRDVALWKKKNPNITIDEVEEVLSNIVLHPGAKELIHGLHDQDVKTAVVSGGIANAAHRVARHLGIPLVAANELVTFEDGRLSGEGVVNTPLRDKAIPVRRFAKELSIPLGQVASVGNSSPDIPMFWTSALGIAFDPSDQSTRDAADVVVEGKDLRALAPVILGKRA